ncbi:fibronectin type III domain-containing protein, partial [Spirosoma arcticum]
MRFIYSVAVFSVFAGAVLWPALSQATHVRAGEITTRRTSETSLTYEITLTAYYDETPKGRQAAAEGADEYTICFGDGTTQVVRRDPKRFINGGTSSINTYRVTHTYPGPGAYTISVAIPNRNENTKNLPPPDRSDDIIFYVSTTIFINQGLGLNSTPRLLNTPLDSGRVGQRFCHNPAAFDPDGDSLAYRLSVPQELIGTSGCRGRAIPAYQDPTRFSTVNEAGAPTPTFAIDARTGELCWDAPGQEGQYNFAFIVEEWRNGVLIGEVTRDMQIIVLDQPNKRPLIAPLPELCVVAGTLINQPIQATDPDGNRVLISAFGGVFNVGPDGQPLPPGQLVPPAFARLTGGGSVTSPLTQPATASFVWQTGCEQLRLAPYDVTLKVTDVPARGITPLVSFQTLRIRLIGPPVQNLSARPTATANGRAIQLRWTAYTCAPRTDRDTTSLLIYRKEGCAPFTPEACETGLRPGLGYQLVGRVGAGATSFIDTSALSRGVSYSYRIVAQYPDRSGNLNGGVSVTSQQACVELPRLAPVLTQVTVDSTNAQRGQITVRWSRPIGLQAGDLGGPYQYRLERATGQTGTNWTPLATINTSLTPGAADTVYIDRGSSAQPLNTEAEAYRYRLGFYYTDPTTGQLTRLDITDPASSVRLTAMAAQRQVRLSWAATVPWSNDNQTHTVFRSRTGPNGPFNAIADVPVRGPESYTYVDTGGDTFLADGNTSRVLSADSAYCYRVLTRGTYADPTLAGLGAGGLLLNYSQIQCATPTDTARPCPPQLGLDSLNCASLTTESLCNQTSFTNTLRWQPTTGPACDPNIAAYRLYYSRYQTDSLTALTTVAAPTTSFAHSSLSTVAGCYYVTALSGRGIESRPSNRVCQEA